MFWDLILPTTFWLVPRFRTLVFKNNVMSVQVIALLEEYVVNVYFSLGPKFLKIKQKTGNSLLCLCSHLHWLVTHGSYQLCMKSSWWTVLFLAIWRCFPNMDSSNHSTWQLCNRCCLHETRRLSTARVLVTEISQHDIATRLQHHRGLRRFTNRHTVTQPELNLRSSSVWNPTLEGDSFVSSRHNTNYRSFLIHIYSRHRLHFWQFSCLLMRKISRHVVERLAENAVAICQTATRDIDWTAINISFTKLDVQK